jgi:hypothetical protein
MDDSILSYFHENLESVTKEELLQALTDALQSANYWRDACLIGRPSLQTLSHGEVGIESDHHDAHNKGDSVSDKI